MSPTSFVSGRRLAVAAAALAVTGLAAAQSAPTIYTYRIPVNTTAPATASGEAVRFQGTGTITSRLALDPDSGVNVLLATFDTRGIVGTGLQSQSRYTLNSEELLVLPHAAAQSVSITFPLEPSADSPLRSVRTGLAEITFTVNIATGALTSLVSSRMGLL